MISEANRVRINKVGCRRPAIYPARLRVTEITTIVKGYELSLEVKLKINYSSHPVSAEGRFAGAAAEVFHGPTARAEGGTRHQHARRFKVFKPDFRAGIL